MNKNTSKIMLLFTTLFVVLCFLILYDIKQNSINIECFNNVGFLFTESHNQLKEYYPKFHLIVFLLTRFIKYGIIVLIAYALITNIKKATSLLKKFDVKSIACWWCFPIVFFVLNFLVSLVFYFWQFNENFIQQLLLTKLFLVFQLFFLLFFIISNLHFLKEKLVKFLFKPILPFDISIFRILFFSYLAFLYLTTYKFKGTQIVGLEKVALPMTGWLIKILPINYNIYEVVCYIGFVLCIFIIFGYKTRLFLLLNIPIVFYIVAVPNFFGKLWHEQIVIWIAWIMAFSACYDVLSIDAIKQKKPLLKKGEYGFHLKIIWLHFGMIYFFAGFYKLWLCGFDWALGSSMINQVQLEWFENYNKIPNIRIDHFPHLLKIGGLLTIIFELFYFVFLFNKKTKWISIIGGLIMHNIIGHFMYIYFLHLLQVFYIVFIPWNSLLTKLKLLKRPWVVMESVPLIKRTTILIPLLIFTINILFGIFRIDSYPFSIYPVYAAIVPDTFKYMEIKIKNKGAENINIRQLGKENNFRWESYSRFEPEIINKYEETGVLDTNKIIQQWHRWQNGVDALKDIDSIEIYAVEVYLNPEKQQDTIKKYKLIDLW